MDLLNHTATFQSNRDAFQSIPTKPLANTSSTIASIKKPPEEELQSAFFVICTGQIVCGDIYNADDLYCRYTLTYGNDWTILHGSESGLSQIARKGPTTFQGMYIRYGCVYV